MPSITHRSPVRRLGVALAAALACASATAAVAPAAHAEDYYKLGAQHSGMVIDVQGASTQRGAPVIQWYDNGGANQHWTLPIGMSDSGADGSVRNQNSGMCLTTDMVAGDQLYQYPCLTLADGEPVATQNWHVQRVNGNGISWYSTQLTNVANGQVVDVSGSSYRPGAPIITWWKGTSRWTGFAPNQVFEQYRA